MLLQNSCQSKILFQLPRLSVLPLPVIPNVIRNSACRQIRSTGPSEKARQYPRSGYFLVYKYVWNICSTVVYSILSKKAIYIHFKRVSHDKVHSKLTLSQLKIYHIDTLTTMKQAMSRKEFELFKTKLWPWPAPINYTWGHKNTPVWDFMI